MFNQNAAISLPKKLHQLGLILQHASQIVAEQYEMYCAGHDFSIQTKSDASPVTQVDLQSHQYLTHELQLLSPHLPILSEEGDHDERLKWSIFWMIDPLDGTKEFIHKTGEFTINLSLIDNGESVISAIAVPLKKTVYISEKGQLPFKVMWSTQSIQAYQYMPDQAPLLTTLRIAISRRPEKNSKYAELMDYLAKNEIEYEKVQAGSAYKFCMMLEGEIDLYPRFHPTSEWDTAAGQGLLNSIGGQLYDPKGRPFVYNQRQHLLNGSFLAWRNCSDQTILEGFSV